MPVIARITNNLPHGGTGMTAHGGDFRPGDRIINGEVPLLNVVVPHAWANWSTSPFFQNERTCQSTHIANAVANLNPGDLTLFQALHGNPNPIDIVQNNAFGDSAQGGNATVLRVFERISRFNHSCLPNAHFYWDLATNRGMVRANKCIRSGDQIFLCYTMSNAWNRTVRRIDLQNTYGFWCACPACSTTGNNTQRARQRRSVQLRTQMEVQYDILDRHHPKICANGAIETEVQVTRRLGRAGHTRLEWYDLYGRAVYYVKLMTQEGIRDDRYAKALYMAAYFSKFVLPAPHPGMFASEAAEHERVLYGSDSTGYLVLYWDLLRQAHRFLT